VALGLALPFALTFLVCFLPPGGSAATTDWAWEVFTPIATSEVERTVSEIEILEKLATICEVLVDGMRAIETYEALTARAAHAGLIDVEVRARNHLTCRSRT
jgi:hypothetical protein